MAVMITQLHLFLPFLPREAKEYRNWNTLCKYVNRVIPKFIHLFYFVLSWDKWVFYWDLLLTKNIKQIGFTHHKQVTLHSKDMEKLKNMKLTKLIIGPNVCGDMKFDKLTTVLNFAYTDDNYWERDIDGGVMSFRNNIDAFFPPHMQQFQLTDTTLYNADFQPYHNLETIIFDACELENVWLPQTLKELKLKNTILHLNVSKMTNLTSLTINNPGFFSSILNNSIGRWGFFKRQCKLELPPTLEKLTLGRGINSIICEYGLPKLSYLSLDHFGYLLHLPICPSLATVKLNEKQGQIIHSEVVNKLLAILPEDITRLEVVLRRTHNLHRIHTILSVCNVREFYLTSRYCISLKPLYSLTQLGTIVIIMLFNTHTVNELLHLATQIKQITVRDITQTATFPHPFQSSLVEVKDRENEYHLLHQWTWLRRDPW